VSAIERIAPGKTDEFKGWCGCFGQCPAEETEPKAADFHQYLLTNLGPEFITLHMPQLVRLIPEEVKRAALLKSSGVTVQASDFAYGENADVMDDFGAKASELFNMAANMAAAQAEETATDIQALNIGGSLTQEFEETRAMMEKQREREELERKTPQYLRMQQKPISEIIEEVRLMHEKHQPWKGNDAHLQAIERCMQYAQSLCSNGFGETAIAGWHVTSAIDSTLGFQSNYVLVLTSAAYFR
jgi:hypothetical protein